MIEHCISALKLNREEKSYKIYITDTLMAIAENTTHFLGRNDIIDYGKAMNKRWVEIIEPEVKEPEKIDDRPAKEIAADIWERIRGR